MRIKNVKELDGFIEAVNKCKGDVWLVSPRDDKYNLKSDLIRYIALGELLSAHGDNMELFCASKEDEVHFFEYFRQFPEVN